MKCRECKDYIPLCKVKGLCDWGAFCVETKPEKLMSLLRDAIDEIFDYNLYEELKERESEERSQFRAELKEYINSLK